MFQIKGRTNAVNIKIPDEMDAINPLIAQYQEKHGIDFSAGSAPFKELFLHLLNTAMNAEPAPEPENVLKLQFQSVEEKEELLSMIPFDNTDTGTDVLIALREANNKPEPDYSGYMPISEQLQAAINDFSVHSGLPEEMPMHQRLILGLQTALIDIPEGSIQEENEIRIFLSADQISVIDYIRDFRKKYGETNDRAEQVKKLAFTKNSIFNYGGEYATGLS